MLVTFIDKDTDKVIKLAHFSVKEYLVFKKSTTEEDKGVEMYRFSNELAHATVAQEAVEYLLQTNDGVVSEQMKIERPLLPYSARFWYLHAKAAGDDIDDFPQLKEQINKIFRPEYRRSFHNWFQIYDCDESYDRYGRYVDNCGYWGLEGSSRPLYYASLLGFQDSVKELLEEGMDATVYGGRLFNPLVAASINGHSKIVAQLVDKYSRVAGVFIETIVKRIRRNARETLEVLLNARAMDWVIRKPKAEVIGVLERVLAAAASNHISGKEVMTILLDQGGEDLPITEMVVEAAIGNYSEEGKEVMKLLLDRQGKRVPISEKAVIAAAEVRYQNGEEMMTLLLDRRGEDVLITEEVVMATARNEGNGKDLMTLLLKRRGRGIPITSSVMDAVAKNYKTGKEVMALLLDEIGRAHV